MDLLKPYMLLACVAFIVGFDGYWALGHALIGGATPPAGPVYQAPVSTPLPADDLARSKAI